MVVNPLRIGLGIASVIVMIVGLVFMQHRLGGAKDHPWICNTWIGTSMFVVGWLFATANLSNDPVDDWPKWPFIKTY